jgi:4'-phosphopantetheinyl transferase
MNIRVYFAGLSVVLTEQKFRTLLKDIPEHWHASIMKYNRANDRALSIAAKWILHRELSIHYPDATINFNNGVPAVEGISTRISISHTPGMVVCAISDYGNIGVDVEVLRNINPADFRSVLSGAEIQLLNTRAHSSPLFFDIWTRKESIAKASERGMYLNFASFSAHDPIVETDGKLWKTISLDVSTQFAAALAYPASEEPSIATSIEQLWL